MVSCAKDVRKVVLYLWRGTTHNRDYETDAPHHPRIARGNDHGPRSPRRRGGEVQVTDCGQIAPRCTGHARGTRGGAAAAGAGTVSARALRPPPARPGHKATTWRRSCRRDL